MPAIEVTPTMIKDAVDAPRALAEQADKRGHRKDRSAAERRG
jgi:hypothetical protein